MAFTKLVKGAQKNEEMFISACLSNKVIRLSNGLSNRVKPATHVEIHIDVERRRIAILPTDDEGEYSLFRHQKALLCGSDVINRFFPDVNNCRIPVTYDEATGMYVGDIEARIERTKASDRME